VIVAATSQYDGMSSFGGLLIEDGPIMFGSRGKSMRLLLDGAWSSGTVV